MNKFRAQAPYVELGALLEALPPSPDDAVARARADAEARPIRYPIGSGQGDEIALRAGLRPMMREMLAPADVSRAILRYARVGLVAEVAPRAYARTSDGWDHATAPPEVAQHALFVSRDRGRIAEGIACDLAKTTEADRELGRLLGYPRCCVEAFVENPLPRRNIEVQRAAHARTRGPAAPRLNGADLAVFHFAGWFPCAYDCQWTIAFADALAMSVARLDAPFVVSIDAALARHRLVFADDVQVSVAGRRDGDGVVIDGAWPTARDRHPSARLDPAPLAVAARATAAIRGARRLAVDGRHLKLDDRVWELPMAPLLLCFGR